MTSKALGPAIDCHAHVFHRRLAFAPGRRYTPAYDATLDAYLAMLDANGFRGGVLVQPSFLGTDNSFLLQSIAEAPLRVRGVAVVDPGSSAADLTALARQGIVGLRLNLVGMETPDFTGEPWLGLLGHAATLDLHIEVQADAQRLVGVVGQLLAVGGPAVVIDHFALPDHASGAADPALDSLFDLAAGANGRLWMKLSATYRLGGQQGGDQGAARAAALVPRIKAAFGCERLLFGTDWPHTGFESPVHVGAARTALEAWFPDSDERRQVALVGAAHLFKLSHLLEPPETRTRP